jgi:hypothetical protein
MAANKRWPQKGAKGSRKLKHESMSLIVSLSIELPFVLFVPFRGKLIDE